MCVHVCEHVEYCVSMCASNQSQPAEGRITGDVVQDLENFPRHFSLLPYILKNKITLFNCSVVVI